MSSVFADILLFYTMPGLALLTFIYAVSTEA